jgi:tellurium resistance protein TerD
VVSPTLSAVAVCLGWDASAAADAPFDLNVSAIACGHDGWALSERHVVFYNNLRSPDGAIEHTGDNRDGGGDGDDEVIEVDLAGAPPDIVTIVCAVSIHDAAARGQTFGQVANAYIRVVNRVDDEELAHFDLSEDADTDSAMVFGELYRHGGHWRFRAIGRGYPSLPSIVDSYLRGTE